MSWYLNNRLFKMSVLLCIGLFFLNRYSIEQDVLETRWSIDHLYNTSISYICHADSNLIIQLNVNNYLMMLYRFRYNYGDDLAIFINDAYKTKKHKNAVLKYRSGLFTVLMTWKTRETFVKTLKKSNIVKLLHFCDKITNRIPLYGSI